MSEIIVRAVLTRSGFWVHYALVGADRTVCGVQVGEVANPGNASCHRCDRWARQRRVLITDTDGETFPEASRQP
jgi:hypothetical protein